MGKKKNKHREKHGKSIPCPFCAGDLGGDDKGDSKLELIVRTIQEKTSVLMWDGKESYRTGQKQHSYIDRILLQCPSCRFASTISSITELEAELKPFIDDVMDSLKDVPPFEEDLPKGNKPKEDKKKYIPMLISRVREHEH